MLTKLLKRSDYARHAATLMAGTAVSQVIPVLFSPILSRLYSPVDFGVFSVFMAVTMVCSVLVAARYEPGILLPSTNEDAANVLVLAIAITTGLSTLLMIACVLINSFLHSIRHPAALDSWCYYVAPAIFFIGLYQAAYYWTNRVRRYDRMAISALVQNIAMVALSLIMGLWASGPHGLILGFVIGKGIGFAMLAFLGWRSHADCLRGVTTSGVLTAAHRYQSFPRYSAPAALINVMVGQMPVFMLTAFFPASIVGHYGLTQRVLGAPVALVGRAMGDVYRERAAADFNRLGNCSSIYRKTFGILALIGFPIFLILLIGAPWLFRTIFGSEWEMAGYFAQIQSPMLFIGMIASPLSMTIYVAEKQRPEFIWQISLLFITTVAAGVGSYYGRPDALLGLWTASYIAMYFIYLSMSYSFAKGAPATFNKTPDRLNSSTYSTDAHHSTAKDCAL